MIVRQWRAWASYSAADEYEQHFREHVIPELKEIDGFVRGHLLRRDNYGIIELVVQTIFVSMDAVKAFAGEQFTHAVVAPEAKALLERYDERCTHWELAAETDGS
jgi:heme-degrading monooxygenase HmoA